MNRQSLLDEHDRRVKELQESGHPDASKERRLEAGRSELERLHLQLDHVSVSHLPPVFQVSDAAITNAALKEMKEAIETVQTDLKDWQEKSASIRAELAKAASNQTALCSERDKLYQRAALLATPHANRDNANGTAQTSQLRLMEQERQTNEKLAAMVAALRLKIAETKLASEQAQEDLRELNQHVLEARILVAGKTIDQMQRRYREAAEAQENALKQAVGQAREHGPPVQGSPGTIPGSSPG